MAAVNGRRALARAAAGLLCAALVAWPAPAQAAPRYRTVYYETFSRHAAPGTFDQVYAGRGWTYPDYPAQPGEPPRYRRANVSVHDGELNLHVANGTGAAVILGMAGPDGHGQVYGRWTISWQVKGGDGHGPAILLWPVSDRWTEGEVDIAEGEFNAYVKTFHHETGCEPTCWGHIRKDPPRTRWQSGWHRSTVEWTPTAVRYYLDGRRYLTVTRCGTAAGSSTETCSWLPYGEHRLTVQSSGLLHGGYRPGTMRIGSVRIEQKS